MDTNTSHKQTIFLEIEGVPSSLNIRSPMASPPVGFEITPTLASRVTVYAMKRLEADRGLQIKVGSGAFPIKNLKLRAGQTIEIPTNYGFYCDDDQGDYPLGVVTMLMLIAGGHPPDVPRVISRETGMAVRTVGSRAINRTNLIVVPPDQLSRWMTVLPCTSLVYEVFQSPNDVERYLGDRQGLAVIEALLRLDVILLSSTIYKLFHRVFENITWGRVILVESENHPKVINSVHFREEAEFTWYLAPDPSSWIAGPVARSRFLARRIFHDDYNCPSFFYVRSEPSFLKRCLVSPPPIVPPRSRTRLEEDLLQLGKDLCRQQETLTHEYHRSCHLIRESIAEENAFGAAEFYSQMMKISLETTDQISNLTSRRRADSPGARALLDHNIGQVMKTCNSMMSSLGMVYTDLTRARTKDQVNQIDSICEDHERMQQGLRSRYGEEIQKAIHRLINEEKERYLTQDPVALYVIENCGRVDVSVQTLHDSSNKLFPGYQMIYGQVSCHSVLSGPRDIQTVNMILGLRFGTTIRVDSRVPEGAGRSVSTLREDLVILDPNDASGRYRVPANEEMIFAETFLLAKNSIFFLAGTTRAVTTSGQIVVLPSGSSFTIVC